MKKPEISFVTADYDKIMQECLKIMENYLGRPLERADPLRLLLNSLLAIIIQQRLLIDQVAKQNLLAYATGEYLERLGDLVGVERLPAAYATTTVEVTLSAPREQATTIKSSMRITADNVIFFALDKNVIFAAGETKKTAQATCTEAGEVGNNFIAGEIDKIVDPQPFLLSIVNVTKSEGGADVEADESLRNRVHEAPESFSNAGPAGAYIFWAKSTSALISDVAVDSSEPGKVEVYVLLKGGVLPEEEMLQAVYKKLSADTIRPLTDQVSVLAPEVVEYDLDVSYWLDENDATQAAQIVEDADKAVEEYIAYQSEKIGRDINPDELIHRLKAAGVKRVEIRSPQFTVLDKFSVAQLRDKSVVFEGLEEG